MGKIKKIVRVVHRNIICNIYVYLSTDFYIKKHTKYLKKIGIEIRGNPKFIANDVYFDGTDYSKIFIDDNVTVSREVMFLTHDYSITTALASIGIKINRNEGEKYFLKEIRIGKNCFIGARASILPGTSIGDNVIVGSNTVVKGNVPENSIIVGNPWKIIGNTIDYAKLHKEKEDYFTE